MKYEIEDFDDFLLSEDIENVKMGYTMLRKSINPKRLTLDELIYFKAILTSVPYLCSGIPNRNLFIILIDKFILRFSKMARINATYRVQKNIKK